MSILQNINVQRTSRIYDKIKKETGLSKEFLIWYKAFNEDAATSEGIVMPEDVKFAVQEFMLCMDGKYRESWDEYTDAINDVYEFALKEFEKRKLIDYIISESGYKYPKVIGYNYMDDPEFCVAYRENGKERWSGRVSTPLELVEIVRYLHHGYEFREKDITNIYFN